MYKIKSVDDLSDLIGFVVLSAPDNFHDPDLLPEDQWDLDKAFEQLRSGVDIAYPEATFGEKRRALYALLEQSLAGYRTGDIRNGAHTLQEFGRSIFKE